MSILSLFSNIQVPSIEKKTSVKILEEAISELVWAKEYLEKLNATKAKYQNTPIYKEHAKMFQQNKLEEPRVALVKLLPQVITIANKLVHDVDKYFPTALIIFGANKSGVSNNTMVYMRAVSHMDFLSKYISRLIHGIMLQFQPVDGATLSPAEHEDLSKYGKFIAILLKAYSSKDMSTGLEDMIDCVVTNSPDAYEMLVAAYGEEKIDPLYKFTTSNFVPTIILNVRLKLAEYRAARYHQLQATRATLEVRLAYLRSEETSPANERQIAYEENRLKDLTTAILLMEASVQ